MKENVKQNLPWVRLLDTVKAALRIIFANIWHVEVKLMFFIWQINFRNFNKLEGKKKSLCKNVNLHSFACH